MFDINVGGVVNGLLAFLPGLRERKSGYILNTASAAGLLTIPAAAAYVASKHAVVGLSETLYRELEATRSGIDVSVLCPAHPWIASRQRGQGRALDELVARHGAGGCLQAGL
jgi:short-subunit dehydrogenase